MLGVAGRAVSCVVVLWVMFGGVFEESVRFGPRTRNLEGELEEGKALGRFEGCWLSSWEWGVEGSGQTYGILPPPPP